MLEQKRNLVMAATTGLTAPQLRPFVGSFRNTRRPGSRLVMFTNRSPFVCLGQGRRLDRRTDDYLLGNVDEVVYFNCMSLRRRRPQCVLWPIWKRVFPRLKTEQARRELAHWVFSFVFLRFLLYLDYLQQLPQKPSWVFLTDCRDVVFQDDIFSRIDKPGLYYFMEVAGRTIGECPGNSEMIRHCFGEEGVREMMQKEVSCSGTVLGDYDNIIRYLEAMVHGAMRSRHMPPTSGDDQGMHNYIVHKQLIPNLRMLDNNSGPVGTMGNVPPSEIRRTPEGLVLQRDGLPYAVLHQHDRFKFIVESHPAYAG